MSPQRFATLAASARTDGARVARKGLGLTKPGLGATTHRRYQWRKLDRIFQGWAIQFSYLDDDIDALKGEWIDAWQDELYEIMKFAQEGGWVAY